MRILLTGATGLIGRHLLPLLTSEHEVVAVSRSAASLGDTPGVTPCPMDLSLPLDPGALPERVDAIIHLAQSQRHREFPDGAVDIFRVNVAATAELLDYARRAGARQFVFASTGGVCGFKNGPITETDPPMPVGFYLLSKYLGEQLLPPFGDYFSTVTLRYFFVYGPGQWNTVVASTLERLARGDAVFLVGPNGIHLNPTYVQEAAVATQRALDLEGQHVVNVAGPQTVSFRQLAEIAGRLLERQPVFERTQSAALDLVGDLKLMHRLLPDVPHIPLEDGLRQTIESYRARGLEMFHDVQAQS
ncbi:MAG TPA: NAD(P)-dependent oxidoreductase [Chloroflexota bacterium]